MAATEPALFRLGHRPALDGVRAIAILMVVALHYTSTDGGLSGWFDGGFVGVEVFFVLSGFLITSLILAELEDTGSWRPRRFYLRRAFRLIPALYFMVAVCAVAGVVVTVPLFGRAGDQAVAFAISATYVLNLVTAAVERLPVWAAPLWTLCVEVHFYIAWPLLLVAAVRRGRFKPEYVAAAILAASLATRLAMYAIVGPPYQTIVTFCRLDGLAAGALVAIAVHRGWRPGRAIGFAAPAGLAVLALLVVLGRTNEWWMVGAGYTLTDLCAIALILDALRPESPIGRVLATVPFRRVGELSYALYLWHLPVFFALSIHVDGRILIPVAFAASLAVASASSALLEAPLRRLGRRLADRPPQLPHERLVRS